MSYCSYDLLYLLYYTNGAVLPQNQAKFTHSPGWPQLTTYFTGEEGVG